MDRKTLAALTTALYLAGNAGIAGAAEQAKEQKEESQKKEQAIKSAAHGSVELMSGWDNSTLDTILTVPLNTDGRLRLLNRNRVTSDYEGKIGTFHFVNGNYQFTERLPLAGVAGVMGGSAKPLRGRAGLQYLGRFAGLTAFQMVLVSAESQPELFSLTNLFYSFPAGEAGKIVSNLENVTFLGIDGHHLSTQRLRLGLQYRDVQFGIAGDLVEKGPFRDLNSGSASFSYQIGGFGKINF